MFHEYLPYEYTRELEKTEIYALEILDPRTTQQVLEEVNKKFPCDLPHLRRVHGSLIYLTQTRNFQSISELPILQNLRECVKIVAVSLHAPVTREQASKFSALWPVLWKKTGLQPTEKLDDRKYELLEEAVLAECILVKSPDREFRIAVGRGCCVGNLKHPVMEVIAQVSDILKDDISMYLCTDYAVFMQTEPCVMCAMALVHSRVCEIFFKNERTDGLMPGISKHAVHWNNKLNHKFRAYRLIS